jgi:hypothetical protein
MLATLTIPATASPASASITVEGYGDGIQYSVSGGAPGGTAPAAPDAPAAPARAAGPHVVAASGPTPTIYPAAVPYLTDNGGGGFCITVQDRSTSNADVATGINNAYEHRWQTLVGNYLLCPGTPAPAGTPGAPATPALPPAAVAASFWALHGADLLGRPAPSIAPGYALAGKLGYLETHAPTTRQFSNPTPLGPLTIAARGTFLVDWGDGTGSQGPYDTAGAPWPDGQITHAWDDVGRYDVTVVEVWTATWSLAGTNGDLAALRTRGAIRQFEIRQLESVRNR